MIYAEMKGKLPAVFYSEDVLTSNVFGLLKLLPDNLLIELLSLSNLVSLSENLPRENLSDNLKIYDKVHSFEFWKRIETGEPDIFIIFKSEEHPNQQAIVLIEVKYMASKSGSAHEDEEGELQNEERDQLAKYWRGLESKYKNDDKFLIYLTVDKVMPREDIENSIKATGGSAKIYWLSWYKVNEFIEEKSENLQHINDILAKNIIWKILKMLNDYLTFKEFIMFEGWKKKIKSEYPRLQYRRNYNLGFDIYNKPVSLIFQRNYNWSYKFEHFKVSFYESQKRR